MKKVYEEENIRNIADAIREKTKSSDTYKVSEMAAAISEIEGGGVLEDCTIYGDGYDPEEEQEVYPWEGIDGFNKVVLRPIYRDEYSPWNSEKQDFEPYTILDIGKNMNPPQ